MKAQKKYLSLAIGLALASPFAWTSAANATIAATHIYHNHMPNFWPYYDTSTYDSTPVGGAIRYMYDGQAKALKAAPPANYKYLLKNGNPMPHDDFDAYYDHDAKRNAYTSWPAQTAKSNSASHPLSQTQVTMSGAVINNIQSFAELGSFDFYKSGWASDWKNTVGTLKTTNGFNALEPIHFTGHHSMGPLVGPKYFLKDLIFQNVTLQQDYFLGSKFKSSKGFFPTELGFSERLIPTLVKLGIEWSVVGNNHFSRALLDYPYLDQPTKDCLVSPPNRADLQNTDNSGKWYNIGMAHEQQNIVNKFPFAAVPHYVQYVNPETGVADKLAAIPVDQNGSWQEGWDGSAIPSDSGVAESVGETDRVQYFVIAHDGDNSSGRAGSISTWLESGNEYKSGGAVGMGVQEYLLAYPIPENDIQHIQDGSWVDTRDSSSDPDWYHWHIPMGVWKGQLADFNKALGTEFELPTNFDGTPFGHAVSMEYGYHYLERNFALLQAAQNYAETAEQIWLDTHPNYWSPSTDAEKQVTYAGNQLNPYMFSFPVKGDAANDYKGGANPAELGWYFLISSIDSGFGYYDENKDDNVKPSLGFNQSLYFTEPYVSKNLAKDKTGPSMWWVQRYPTNPGSANSGKAEGWTKAYADNTFAIYTYAYDVSGIKDVKVYVRAHKDKRMSPTDIAPRVYEPKKFAGQANVDVNQVGEWKAYNTQVRKLEPDMNGVAWQDNDVSYNYKNLPGKKIGDTYFAYISDYRDQLIDYYMEATDNLGNVTKSEINHAYVGAGRYTKGDSTAPYIEDVNGEIEGVHMFFTDGSVVLTDSVTVYAKPKSDSVGSVYVEYKDKGSNDWVSAPMKSLSQGYFISTINYTRDAGCADVRVHNNGETTYYPSSNGSCLSKGVYTATEGSSSFSEGAPDIPKYADIYFKLTDKDLSKACIHYRGTPSEESAWTKAPGVEMEKVDDNWFKYSLTFGVDHTGMEFLFNDCGSSWYKNSSGGNFTTTDIKDYYVEGTTLKEGTPFTNNPPKAIISASSKSIIVGDSVTLDGSKSIDTDGSIASYKWSTGDTTASITVKPTKTTTYTLEVTDNQGATATSSVTVTVSDKPVVYVDPVAKITASATQITKGETVTLSGADSTKDSNLTISYEWSTGEKTSTIKVAPTETTTYKLTVTDSNGKTSSKSIEIVVQGSEVVVELAPTISVSNTDKYNYTFVGSNKSDVSSIHYTWFVNNKQVGTGKTLSQTLADGDNTIKLVVSYENESKEVTKTITVTPDEKVIPKAVITASNTTISNGDSVVLDASSSKNAASFLWNNGATTSKITVAPSVTTTYSVEVISVDGIKDTKSIKITVENVTTNDNHAPVADIQSNKKDNTITLGDEIILDASASTDTDGDELSYLWNTQETSASIRVSPTTNTVYTVTVTDSKGASSQKAVSVTVLSPSAKPVAVISEKTGVEVKTNEKLVLSGAKSTGATNLTYKWLVNKGVVVAQGSNYTFTQATAGKYIVILEVSDENSQISQTSIVVNVVEPAQVVTSVNASIMATRVRAKTGNNITFSAKNSRASNSSIASYEWYVDNNLNTSSDSNELTYMFTQGGVHNVAVKVTNDAGKSSTASMFVFVEDDVDEVVDIVREVLQDLKVKFNVSLTNTVKTVKYYFRRATTSELSVNADSSDNSDYCLIQNNVVDCTLESGDEYIEVANNKELEVQFAEAGDYVSTAIVTTDDEKTTITDKTFSVTKVTSENNNSSSESSSGGSGGGAFNVLYLMLLGFGARYLRRSKRK